MSKASLPMPPGPCDDQRMRRTRHAAWGAGILALGLIVAAIAITLVSDSHRVGPADVIAWSLAVTATVSVGLLIAVRRDGHPIGWLLVLNGVLAASWAFTDSWARHGALADPGSLPGVRWAVLWADGSWPLMILMLTTMALLFPMGELHGRRERRILRISLASCALMLVLSFTAPEAFPEPFQRVDRPVPTYPDAVNVLWPIGMLGLLYGLIASMRLLRDRFRTASGIERQQLRWLAYAGLLIPFMMIVPLGVSLLGFSDITDSDGFNAAVALVFGVVPATIGVAILRYRLYDIDRIVSRSLVYLALTAILAGVYVGGVLLLQLVLSPSSDLAIAGSTLAVAALFRPLRGRVQAVVDRRFFRPRYDGQAMLQAFAARLRDEVSLDAVDTELRSAVAEMVQPAHVSLWVRP